MTLRKHQAEMVQVCDEINAGADIRKIIAAVTPGGGKSALPIILCDKLLPHFAEKLLWVVPRNSLKYQGEADFCDPYWKTRHRLRATNGNEEDPARGCSGYITTYQAIGTSPRIHHEEFRKHDYILFLDEPHHVADGGPWAEALEYLVENAMLVIYASGTLSRGDGQKIAFLDYAVGYVNLETPDKHTRVIQYTRSDALSDGAICQIHFHTIDGSAEWEKEGQKYSAGKLSQTSSERGDALFTALRTEYAYQLLQSALTHWQAERIRWEPAAMLVVSPDIKTAKEYQRWLESRGFHSRIATSDDTPQARRNINDFRRGIFDILNTVGMAYEGLSVKRITHIGCLTEFRSVPWLEQCFGRGNRVMPGKTAGHIFGPEDPAFKEAIRMIEREQAVALHDNPFAEMGSSESSQGKGGGEPRVNPLRSAAHVDIGPEIDLSIPQVAPSDQEKALKDQIRSMRRLVLQSKRNGAQRSAARLFDLHIRRIVDKKLDVMTVEELSSVWQGIRQRYGK